MANSIITLSGQGFGSVRFPLTSETITFGSKFELKELFGYYIATAKWSFEPISLAFKLVAGMGSGKNGTEIPESPDDASSMLTLCADLMKSSIPTKGNSVREDTSRLKVGNWFTAEGYTQGVTYEFGGPWDASGKPMSVDVTLDFQPVIFRKKDNPKDGYRRVWRDDFNNFGNIR